MSHLPGISFAQMCCVCVAITWDLVVPYPCITKVLKFIDFFVENDSNGNSVRVVTVMIRMYC